MYYELFSRLFQTIERVCETEIRWQHIHGDGFVCATMDMDTKQMPGNISLTRPEHVSNISRIRPLPSRDRPAHPTNIVPY
jgi:hypothetical protein